jgi:hypothetical protein
MNDPLEDLQGEVDDLDHSDIADHLECAASCETFADFRDNIQNAIDAAHTLISNLTTLRDQTRDQN